MSGTATQGQTLTTTNGTWSNSPTSFTYAWQDCSSSGGSCTNISGASGSSYTLGAGDVGHTIRAVVTATNAGGSGSGTSAPSAVVAAAPPPPSAPTNTAVPAISGSAVQGQTLSTSNGTWSGSPTSYKYHGRTAAAPAAAAPTSAAPPAPATRWAPVTSVTRSERLSRPPTPADRVRRHPHRPGPFPLAAARLPTAREHRGRSTTRAWMPADIRRRIRPGPRAERYSHKDRTYGRRTRPTTVRPTALAPSTQCRLVG